jgi:hypothetical protein
MAGREDVVGVVELVQGEGKLADVVLALEASGGFASSLDGGEEQSEEDRHDGEDNEELDQGETDITVISTRRE